jgi:hypothetical protein
MEREMMTNARQAQVDAIALTDPEQIATLPWIGNHAADYCLFDKIEQFIRYQLHDQEKKRRALHLMALYGMGIDQPVSDDDLALVVDSWEKR